MCHFPVFAPSAAGAGSGPRKGVAPQGGAAAESGPDPDPDPGRGGGAKTRKIVKTRI